jgi:hypothetical protein
MKSIKKFKLVKHFPSHFIDIEEIEEKMLGVVEDKPEKTLLQQARNEPARASSVR